MTDGSCVFCLLSADEIVERRGPCVAIWTNEAPEGSAMVIPLRHRRDAWELTSDEWSATRELLSVMRDRVTRDHKPDGWNIGWNVGEVGGQVIMHAHCHLVPRYADENYAGRGMRWWLKQPDNTRSGRGQS
jgi:diadenosine tetraphosphate (Ap4A) HIT family hydrolase